MRSSLTVALHHVSNDSWKRFQ